MRREPPVPPALWDQIPPHVQAALGLVVEGYEQRRAALAAEGSALREEVRELKAQLGQNSQTSSRPLSSDGPHVKRKPPQAAAGRKRGGQPGHPVHQRAVLSLEHVDEGVERQPTHCRRCGGAVHGTEVEPRRPQVVEVPPPAPHGTAYQ
jgi:transposase